MAIILFTESVDMFAAKAWKRNGLVESRRGCNDELLIAEMIMRWALNKMGSGRAYR